MMSSYMERFAAAHLKSTSLFGPQINPRLNVDPARSYGAEVVKAVADDLKDGVVTSAVALAGICFQIAREASYVLFELGIDNAVTIGTVLVDSKPYFTTTEQSLEAELRTGFEPNVAANAHAWLTLDSGQVIDATLLPSIAYHQHRREIEIDEAVYLSNGDGAIEYIPMLTGFSYHLRVVTHPLAGESFVRYCTWLKHVGIFQRKIARMRAGSRPDASEPLAELSGASSRT